MNSDIRRLRNGRLLYFFIYFILLLFCALFVKDISLQPELMTKAAAFPLEMKRVGVTDPASFISGALDIYKNGWISPENAWLTHLWPPGFMILEAMILKVFGENAPVIVYLIIISAALYAIVLMQFRSYLTAYASPLWALALPAVPFAFPVTRLFILQPLGVVLGEGFSIAFLLLGVLAILKRREKSSQYWAVVAGIYFALSAYFRSQYEIFITVLTLLALTMVVFSVIHRRLLRGRAIGVGRSFALRNIVFAVFYAQLFMIPWRLHNFYESGAPGWVQTQALEVRNSFTSSEELLKHGGGWIVSGKGNLGCLLEPKYCGAIESKYFYKTFFTHIGEWYWQRVSVIADYWFSSLRNHTAPVQPNTWGDIVINLALLLSVLAVFPLLALLRRQPEFTVYCWLILGLYASLFCIYSLVHYETRYFYFPKIFSLFINVLLGMSVYSARRRPHKLKSSEIETPG